MTTTTQFENALDYQANKVISDYYAQLHSLTTRTKQSLIDRLGEFKGDDVEWFLAIAETDKCFDLVDAKDIVVSALDLDSCEAKKDYPLDPFKFHHLGLAIECLRAYVKMELQRRLISVPRASPLYPDLVEDYLAIKDKAPKFETDPLFLLVWKAGQSDR